MTRYRRRRWSVATAALCLISAMTLPLPALAQLRDCLSISRGPHYKVVLGDVSVAAATDMEAVRQRLIAKLKTSEEALRLDGEQRKLSTAVCPGRQPRDETEFDRNTIDDLNALNVVLEVWGSVSTGPQPSRRQEARINFALISLMKFEPAMNGMMELSFPRTAGPAVDALSELMLAELTEMRALTALSVALRLHRDGRYDAAKRSYCEANAHLTRAASAPGAPTSWLTLRDFSLKNAATVVRDAQADSEYRGALKLGSAAATPCAPPA